MGLLKRLFGAKAGPDVVAGARVLVCALGPGFEPLLSEDAAVYKAHYPPTVVSTFATGDQLFAALSGQFDVVHVFCAAGPDGMVSALGANGTTLIEKGHASGVKLLWVASGNLADAYIKGFSLKECRINLVMTLDRRGGIFSGFLDKLLARMAAGEAMPAAWSDLSPQIPGAAHPQSSDAIFAAGYPSVRLRRS